MHRVKADLIPRIVEKWGQKNSYYKSPFYGRGDRWVQAQQDIFCRLNPVRACDNHKKTTWIWYCYILVDTELRLVDFIKTQKLDRGFML